MRLLITGAAGMLGQDVVAAALAAGHDPVALSRAELDITDAEAVDAAVDGVKPDAVVNCAAWTNVDGAETNEPEAVAVNGEGAGHVAAAAARGGAWTVHVSSDYVFDGERREPYLESAPTNPASAYGRSKLAGEHAVAESAPGLSTVVRSSWLFGAGGPCFPATILQLASGRSELTVVDDQVGCPTFTGHLAPALVELCTTRRPGVLHVAGSGRCSWFEFATAIVAAAGLECEVQPIPTTDMPRPATRPAYSVLRTERGAPQLPEWQLGLEQYMALRIPAR
jgi:dTDP-4-dehydrorhamnose reductase